jgi:hypothetical protein
MSLKHKLSLTSVRIPELHAPVLAARKNPMIVRSKGNTENKVLDYQFSELNPYYNTNRLPCVPRMF